MSIIDQISYRDALILAAAERAKGDPVDADVGLVEPSASQIDAVLGRGRRVARAGATQRLPDLEEDCPWGCSAPVCGAVSEGVFPSERGS